MGPIIANSLVFPLYGFCVTAARNLGSSVFSHRNKRQRDDGISMNSLKVQQLTALNLQECEDFSFCVLHYPI